MVLAEKRNLIVLNKSDSDLVYINRDQQVKTEDMESKTPSVVINRKLYADLEPYNTGFLKVSDIHSLYYEQSGNPDGHVSSRCITTLCLLSFIYYQRSNLIVFSFCSQWFFSMEVQEAEHHPLTENSLILLFIGSSYLIRYIFIFCMN